MKYRNPKWNTFQNVTQKPKPYQAENRRRWT